MNKDKKKTVAPSKNPTKKEKPPGTELPEDLKGEIQDSFNLYAVDSKINRSQMRSILGNFGFVNKNVKDIESEISQEFDAKTEFEIGDVFRIIQKKWFFAKGKEEELEEIFSLFDKKNKQLIGLPEIKNVFGQYLDIQISDADILEFISESDLDQDGYINKNELGQKQYDIFSNYQYLIFRLGYL